MGVGEDTNAIAKSKARGVALLVEGATAHGLICVLGPPEPAALGLPRSNSRGL